MLVSASAVGFYGTSETASFNEDSPAGADVLGKLCAQWEAAAQEVNPSTRLVITRIGIVLAADGGALGKMLPIFRAGFGGPIGSGQQWMSWIARTDLCGLIAAALTDSSLQGTYNATAPNPVRCVSFAPSWAGLCGARACCLSWSRLKLLLGDGAEVVLQGQQVLPKTAGSAVAFQAPQLDQALALSLKG